ncbi:hypothetical protein [Acinetobacter rudis]|uniref:hypothetical protein n=1 Tax=Acinetobacter rudis TaxID=632955 RepID=UPI00333E25EF
MMPFNKYQENRLTVVGIEAPDNQRKSTAGTRVRLSNGQYLGDVKDIQITGGLDNAWKVQVITSSVLTNEQVSNLFVKGGVVPDMYGECKSTADLSQCDAIKGQSTNLTQDDSNDKTTDS